jgi:hypothetical protein
MATSQFEGWLGHDKSAVKGNMQWGKFEPKKWTEDDVDIEISHCGVCGSDLHTLSSGWSPTPYRKSSDVTSRIMNADLNKPASSVTKLSARPYALAPT